MGEEGVGGGEEGSSSTSTSIASFSSASTSSASASASTFYEKVTLEQAIHNRLANFFDKRGASGDSRPCGPHDMVPIYMSVFGIGKEELRDERFLGRLRRSGLGGSVSR